MRTAPTASEFGSLAPGVVDRAVVALTSALPDSWFGQRLAIGLRRITTMRLAYPDGALDVQRWGMRLRLHPRDNGCEKNLLFTPQMYELAERAALAAEIERARTDDREYVFIDIGANVGLFSLFVAACARERARILAIEPEAGNLERLTFNIAVNPGVQIRTLPFALGDQAGEAAVDLHRFDRGGTRTRKIAGGEGVHELPRVKVQTLLEVVRDEKIDAIDAIKIDVEGAEDAVLAPFIRDAPKSLWPRLLLIEDARRDWASDLFALLAASGFTIRARSKLNVIMRRE